LFPLAEIAHAPEFVLRRGQPRWAYEAGKPALVV